MSKTDTTPETRYLETSQQLACEHFLYDANVGKINIEASTDTSSFVTIQRNPTGLHFYVNKMPYSDSRSQQRTPFNILSETDARTKLRFEKLYVEWMEDTCFLSSTSEIVTNSAYQQIIGLGQRAIPLILEKLEKKQNYWFWALKAISGDDPVPPELAGNIKAMSEVWLNWGKLNGYVAKA